MEHRRLLGQEQTHRGPRVFEQIGGAQTVDKLVDGLYDRIETDAELRQMFGRHLENERAGQKRFFAEWLGGAHGAYSERAYLPLKHRHDLLPITPKLAEQWLGHFRRALEAAVIDEGARKVIDEHVTQLARALVDEGEPVSAFRARAHGVCLRYGPAKESLELARRGDASGLATLLGRVPEVLKPVTHAASLLYVAALGGRTAVVQVLLDAGVDVNKPSPIEPMIMVTALCAARLRGRKQTEAVLIGRGAREDIFTHALLGDLAALQQDLQNEPAAAQASDPAVDALEITPVHHAVAGDRVEAVRLLLSKSSGSIRGGGRALRGAVAHENVAIVGLLLDRGADATSIGSGRWVLHPELAPLLSRAGARVDASGGWIGQACTGNQGRKDDPEFVAALLRYGASVHDRRLVGQGVDGGHATALHYAAKAGFLKTIALLLEQGADPGARDDNGCTPRDWLERSAKSVDRDAVRRLLRQK